MKKIAICAALAALCACSGANKGWKVEGSVAGAPEGAKLAVEGFNGARWYTIDSVALKADGSFAFAAEQGSAYPDVYRLGYDGRSIYFPIDSIESVRVEADASAFDKGYTLSGSPLADEMMRVEGMLAQAPDSAGMRQLGHAMLQDTTGVISYYLINKTIGGKPLFDPATRQGMSMLGAIANKFNYLFPNDPRAGHLRQRFIEARRQAGMGVQTVLEADEIGLFDIELYDAKGAKQALSEVAKDHPVVLLSFTAYGTEPSLPYNVELNRLYEAYKDRGLEIYQVAFDADEVQWIEAAGNLPWVAVRYNPAEGAALLAKYNVSTLPTTFVIKNGALAERIEDAAAISDAVKRQF